MPAALGLRAGATVQAATGRHFQRERERREEQELFLLQQETIKRRNNFSKL